MLYSLFLYTNVLPGPYCFRAAAKLELNDITVSAVVRLSNSDSSFITVSFSGALTPCSNSCEFSITGLTTSDSSSDNSVELC